MISEPQSVQTRLTAPLRDFIATENSSAIVLLAATIAALVWANSPWSESYEDLWGTIFAVRIGDNVLSMDLRHWINDGLMALFFFVAGLEIRREFDMGELRERRRVATPVIAAFGGMVVPALLYVAFNLGQDSIRGWGITIGTDTAFALGVLAIVGGKASARVRIFLLTAVIVDDIAALSVIAVVYTDDLSIGALATALGLFALVVVLQRVGFRGAIAYGLVGLGVWFATLLSGVHATVAGVALGILATAHSPKREDLEHAARNWRLFREQPSPEGAQIASQSVASTISPNERLQHLLHPWTSYVIVPVFALANAGVAISLDVVQHAASSPITLGVVAGLVIGKPVGILGATWLARRVWGLPLPVPWASLVGAATLAGIGFTVSLLIADISFDGDNLEDAKLGILAASLIAAILSAAVFRGIRLLPAGMQSAGSESIADPIVDLAEAVDPEVDHIRGPDDAPVTIVEYGDFECPYCGRAEPVIRDLAATVGEDLRFVFRHLPLIEVHEHALLAGEAAEAAAEQGKFWEMYDLLFANQGSLDAESVNGYARSLGLDMERFTRGLDNRRHALRVERDVESAVMSSVAGTPTFFINGRRYYGRLNREAFVEAVRAEASRVRTSRR